jgi:hypothetical protein
LIYGRDGFGIDMYIANDIESNTAIASAFARAQLAPRRLINIHPSAPWDEINPVQRMASYLIDIRNKNSPVNNAQLKFPVIYGLPNPPVNSTQPSRPVNYAQPNLPVNYTQPSRPVNYTQPNPPVNYAQSNPPVNYALSNLPVNYVQPNPPVNYAQSNLPVNNARPFNGGQKAVDDFDADNNTDMFDESAPTTPPARGKGRRRGGRRGLQGVSPILSIFSLLLSALLLERLLPKNRNYKKISVIGYGSRDKL